MTSGYLSREAVNDLLAIKEGEKDFLRAQIRALEQEVESLKKQINK